VARRPVRIGNSFRQKLPLFYADHAHLLKSSPGKPNCRRWGRLVVAIQANGNPTFNEWLMRYHGRRISAAQHPDHQPHADYLRWHKEQVFKGQPRHVAASFP
jgi:hypothetical protein